MRTQCFPVSTLISTLTRTGLLACSALILIACSDGTGQAQTEDSTGTSASSLFATSAATTERFGTRTERDASPVVTDEQQRQVVRAMNDLSFDLHRAIVASSPSDDAISSGYSAAVALSLASAATSGDTLNALANLLGVDAVDERVLHDAQNAIALALQSRSNDRLVLRTANRVFVRPGLDLETAFMDIATSSYGAPITEAAFADAPEAVQATINAWVDAQTDGFIDSLLTRPLSPDTVFALLNAIFLDAGWQEPLQALGERPFSALDGGSSEVDSFGGRATVPVSTAPDLTVLELPYAGGELAMMILMPTDLAGFEQAFDARTLESIATSLQTTDVAFSVPNWQTESTLNLMTLLGPVGLPTNEWSFGRLTPDDMRLGVLAIQKARIQVDETGTRAAAVTLIAGDESAPPFIAIDKPFLYVLRDRDTGSVLFTGRVVTP